MTIKEDLLQLDNLVLKSIQGFTEASITLVGNYAENNDELKLNFTAKKEGSKINYCNLTDVAGNELKLNKKLLNKIFNLFDIALIIRVKTDSSYEEIYGFLIDFILKNVTNISASDLKIAYSIDTTNGNSIELVESDIFCDLTGCKIGLLQEEKRSL